MQFDAQLPRAAEDGRFHFSPHKSWTQGRTIFGGLVSAAAVRAAELSADFGTLRTVSSAFLKPLLPEEVAGEIDIEHKGKRVSSVRVLFRQGGELCARVHLLYGIARPSGIARIPSPVLASARGQELPYLEGVTPTFTQHVKFEWMRGPLPFSGSDEDAFSGTAAFRSGSAHRDAMRIALADAFPPPVLARADRPVFASTIQWTVHLLDHSGDDQVLYSELATASARDGYATTTSHIYGEDGRMIAWGEQLVALFD